MTADSGLQLDLFRRVRKPRAQRMRYADRGRDALGDYHLFRCRRCGGELKYRCEVKIGVNAGDVTSVVFARGLPCDACNKGK
jgi:hypothetical protein